MLLIASFFEPLKRLRGKLLNASDYFPGTECRVVAISGAMPTVAKAVSAMDGWR
jgi:hypothetical protein